MLGAVSADVGVIVSLVGLVVIANLNLSTHLGLTLSVTVTVTVVEIVAGVGIVKAIVAGMVVGMVVLGGVGLVSVSGIVQATAEQLNEVRVAEQPKVVGRATAEQMRVLESLSARQSLATSQVKFHQPSAAGRICGMSRTGYN